MAQLLLDIWCQSLITKCRFRKNLYLKQIFFDCKDYVQSVAMIKILHFCTWQWLTLLMTLGFWMLLEWWLINTLPYNKTIKSQYLWWRNVNLIFSGIKQTNKWKFKQNINCSDLDLLNWWSKDQRSKTYSLCLYKQLVFISSDVCKLTFILPIDQQFLKTYIKWKYKYNGFIK